jgi:hypothetical protein
MAVLVERRGILFTGSFSCLSVGMFEHVGAGRYRTFMRRVRQCLSPDGLFLLHTIAGNRSAHGCDPWIATYIFPNSMLPSGRQISAGLPFCDHARDDHGNPERCQMNRAGFPSARKG